MPLAMLPPARRATAPAAPAPVVPPPGATDDLDGLIALATRHMNHAGSPDRSQPLTAEEWMRVNAAVYRVCTASERARSLYEKLRAALLREVGEICARLSCLSGDDVIRAYHAEFERYTAMLEATGGVFSHLNRGFARTHGPRGMSPIAGVYDTATLGLLVWSARPAAPLSRETCMRCPFAA